MKKHEQAKSFPKAHGENRVICTPSQFAKSSLLYVQEIGELTSAPNHDNSRDSMQSFLLLIVESGEGSVTVNGETHKLAKGDCAFIDCRKTCSHSTGDNPWKLKWCHFYGSMMSAFAEYYVSRGGKTMFRPAVSSVYRHRWETMFSICNSDDPLKEMRVNQELSALIAMLVADADAATSGVAGSEWRDRRMERVRAYLVANYNRRVPLDELSKKFSMNKFSLVREFRRRYGMTIHHCLADVRVSRAKELLRFSNKSIEKISAECGVDDANYFARIFKSVEGVTPHSFRRIWRG